MISKLRRFFHIPNTRFLFVCFGVMLFLCGCEKNPKMPKQVPSGYEACWPCAVYEQTFETIEEILETLIKTTCQNAVTLLGFGLLFWLLFHVGKFVVTIQEPNMRKFLFPMSTILFKAIVVFALINNADDYIAFIGEYIVQPILLFFTGVSEYIFESNETIRSVTAVDSVADKVASEGKLFGTVGGQFLNIVYRMFIALKQGTSLGFTIWKGIGVIPFVFGLFVICMFWMLMLTMPLMFLDGFVRLAVILILSPFVLVAWIFPATKSMLGKLWGVFLGTGLSVIFACFYIAITMYLVITFAEKTYPGILSNIAQQTDPDLIDNVQTMSTSTLAFFVLLLAMNRLSAHIVKLANQFGGEAANSSWIRMFGGLKKLSITAGKAALAVALASPSLAKDAASEVKDVASSMAQDGATPNGS